MSDVEFEENKIEYQYAPVQKSSFETPVMTRLLLKWGIIKEANQSNYVLGIIILLCIGLTIYFTLQNPDFRFTSSVKKTQIKNIPQAVKDRMTPEQLKSFPSKNK